MQNQSEWLSQLRDQQQLEQQIQLLEENLRKRLTKEAYQRYANIRAANPEIAVKVLAVTVQQLERRQGTLDDEGFRELLEKIMPKRRAFRITRK
jgi:DNA-binding TFAR19-related protein (PDSD5 family)